MTTKELPTSICLDATTQLLAHEEGKPRRFSMVVNTGKPMLDGWGAKFAFELSGVKVKQKIPVLLGHNANKRIGMTDKVELTSQGLVAEGFLLTNAFAQEVIADAEDGFAWQCSNMVETERKHIEWIESGETTEVNGVSLKGPALIYRKCTMREVTFTAMGRDENTRAKLLSLGGKEVRVSPQQKEAMDPKELTVAKLSELRPDLVSDIKTGAQKDAKTEAETQLSAVVDTERKRVSKILNRATPSQMELAQKLITDGTDLEAATDALLGDENRNEATTSASLTAKTDALARLDASAPGDAPPPGGDQTLSVDEKAWAKLSVADKADHGNSMEQWLHYESLGGDKR